MIPTDGILNTVGVQPAPIRLFGVDVLTPVGSATLGIVLSELLRPSAVDRWSDPDVTTFDRWVVRDRAAGGMPSFVAAWG